MRLWAILAGWPQVVSIFYTLENGTQPSCLDQDETYVRLEKQMKFVRQYRYGAAIAPFGLVLFVGLRYFPNSASRFLDPLGLFFAWAIFVAICCSMLTARMLLIRCPRCGWRFGLGNQFGSCDLPKHTGVSGKVE
jgi:hypothetical protein